MSTPNVTVIYTRKGCPFCEKIKEVYNMKGWNYTEYVLDEQFNREQFYDEFGPGATFPQVIVDNKRTGGATDTIQHFRNNGLL